MKDTKDNVFEIDGDLVSIDKLINTYQESKSEKKQESKARKKRKEEQELKPYQAELIKLQQHIEKTNQKMTILFEGRDAAGKGGTIRRVTRYMDEKHYRIVALGKPTDIQQSQWFYQKYIEHFPHGGEIVLFDRSWYNRAMVESVFNFCTKKEYIDFMKGVKGLEKDLSRQGMIMIKLYFSVTKDEQARRFARRKTDPLRQWKLSEIDLQAQERWDDFTNTKYHMLKKTHSSETPWTVVRSIDKHKARLESLKVILNSVDYEGRNTELDYSLDRDVVISGSRELENMDEQRTLMGKFMG